MRRHVVGTVYRRELRDVLRDRRTLFTMLVLPVLLYPALMLGFSHLTVSRVENLKSRTYPVAITVGGVPLQERQLSGAAPGSLAARLLEVEHFAFTVVDDPKIAVDEGRVLLAVDLPVDVEERLDRGEEVRLVPYHRSADDEAQAVLSAFEQTVREFRRSRLPLIIDRNRGDQATPEEKGGHLFGGMLAMMVILMAMTGAFYPALDVAAGEKERGTLETLLLSPASRLELVAGKYLTVLTVATCAALMNLGSMTLTFAGFSNLLASAGSATSFSISPRAFLVIFLGLVIMAGLFSAVCLALSTFARTYKEGQSYLTPALLLVMPLAMVGLLPNTQLDPGLALVPVANMALLMKGLLVGEFPVMEILLTMGSLSLLAFSALGWTAGLFNREEVLFREGKQVFGLRPPPGVPRPERPAAQVAVLAVLLGLVWMVQVSSVLAGKPPLILISVPLLGLLGIALLLTRLSMVRLRSGLLLRAPTGRGWGAGALLGIGGVGVTLAAGTLQRFVIGDPPEATLGMFEALFALPLPVLILCAAILPAVCEELLFRGLVLQGFRGLARDLGAVTIAAISFGAFHMSIHRFFPQAMLGFLLGLLVLRTRSVWPAVLAHALHNGVLVTWVHLHGGDEASVEEPWFLYPLAAVFMGVGFFLARRDERSER